MSIKSSLFVVMNEHGAVLYFSIVPCDSRDYLRNAFTDIWIDMGTPQTLAVYSDNPKNDKRFVQEAHQQMFAKAPVVELLQV